jgi:hypothetical protein
VHSNSYEIINALTKNQTTSNGITIFDIITAVKINFSWETPSTFIQAVTAFTHIQEVTDPKLVRGI